MIQHPSHIALGENVYVESLGLELDAIEPGLVIELGVWKGMSSIHMAERMDAHGLDGDRAATLTDELRSVGFRDTSISKPFEQMVVTAVRGS